LVLGLVAGLEGVAPAPVMSEVKLMKNMLMVLLVLLGSMTAGCSLVETYPERVRRHKLQCELEARMLTDDVEAAVLRERVTHLTQWHPYVGY
jgi:hypothetical protein